MFFCLRRRVAAHISRRTVSADISRSGFYMNLTSKLAADYIDIHVTSKFEFRFCSKEQHTSKRFPFTPLPPSNSLSGRRGESACGLRPHPITRSYFIIFPTSKLAANYIDIHEASQFVINPTIIKPLCNVQLAMCNDIK